MTQSTVNSLRTVPMYSIQWEHSVIYNRVPIKQVQGTRNYLVILYIFYSADTASELTVYKSDTSVFKAVPQGH